MSNKLLIPPSELLFHALFLPEMKTFFLRLTSHQLGATREEKPRSEAVLSGLTDGRTQDSQWVILGLGGLSLSREPARLGAVRAYQLV